MKLSKENKKLIINIITVIIATAIGTVIAYYVIQNYIIEKEVIDTTPQKEISYYLEPTKTIFDTSSLPNITVMVENKTTNYLYSSSIRVFNTGKEPIKNLKIQYVLTPQSEYISEPGILLVNHETIPKYEFGKITEDESTSISRRYIYELLNPGDEFTITFTTFNKSDVTPYSKIEGGDFKKVSFEYLYGYEPTYSNYFITLFFAYVILIAFLGVLITLRVYKKEQEKKEKNEHEKFDNIFRLSWLKNVKVDDENLQKSIKEYINEIDKENKELQKSLKKLKDKE